MLSLTYPHLEVGESINGAASEVWHLIIDTARWPEWGPSVRAVECADRYIRQGSRGRVQTSVGLWVTFQITAYRRERYWAWRVGGLRATGHRVEPLGESRSRLVFEVPVLASPYVVVCKMALARIRRLVEGNVNTDGKLADRTNNSKGSNNASG